MNKLDQWLNFLVGENLEQITTENKRIAEAEKVLNNLNLTEREKRIMELREKKIRDDKNIRETAIEEVAKNLISLGVNFDTIQKATNLTLEEIKKLK